MGKSPNFKYVEAQDLFELHLGPNWAEDDPDNVTGSTTGVMHVFHYMFPGYMWNKDPKITESEWWRKLMDAQKAYMIMDVHSMALCMREARTKHPLEVQLICICHEFPKRAHTNPFTVATLDLGHRRRR
jgi:hypothetical protein